jgi:hypothetical protein
VGLVAAVRGQRLGIREGVGRQDKGTTAVTVFAEAAAVVELEVRVGIRVVMAPTLQNTGEALA